MLKVKLQETFIRSHLIRTDVITKPGQHSTERITKNNCILFFAGILRPRGPTSPTLKQPPCKLQAAQAVSPLGFSANALSISTSGDCLPTELLFLSLSFCLWWIANVSVVRFISITSIISLVS